MAGKIFIPKVRTKEIVEQNGELFFCCSNCWMPGNLLNFENPKNRFATVTVGIHADIRFDSEFLEMRQYTEPEGEPLVFEVFKFCSFCVDALIERFFSIVTQCTNYSYEELLAKPYLPVLDPLLGHYITLIEYIPGVWEDILTFRWTNTRSEK